jgi:hypothetical protein
VKAIPNLTTYFKPSRVSVTSHQVDDIPRSHVNADDDDQTIRTTHTYRALVCWQTSANLTCSTCPSSILQPKSKVPDRHSPRNQRVICPRERAAPAALALTGACIRPHACCICLMYACKYACTMHASKGRKAQGKETNFARALRRDSVLYLCTAAGRTSDMLGAVHRLRSYRLNSWMRAYALSCACGSWKAHVYIREMQVLTWWRGRSWRL